MRKRKLALGVIVMVLGVVGLLAASAASADTLCTVVPAQVNSGTVIVQLAVNDGTTSAASQTGAIACTS